MIDRVKNIFKLSNGEYVSPENVEAAYTGHCRTLTQLMIHGTSRHSRVVAIVVPTQEGTTEQEVLADITLAAETFRGHSLLSNTILTSHVHGSQQTLSKDCTMHHPMHHTMRHAPCRHYPRTATL